MTTRELTGEEALAALRSLMSAAPTPATVAGPRPASPQAAIAAADGKPLLVAVMTVEAGQLQLCRYTREFPNADLPRAVELLREDLKREAPWEFGGE